MTVDYYQFKIAFTIEMSIKGMEWNKNKDFDF